jgi:enediyne biosynthesis protein E5
MADPRLYQIGTLAALLVYGMGWLEFDITPVRAALILATALATQKVCDRLSGSAAPFASTSRSALISGLSLCLLVRSDTHAVACLAAFLAIASKFLIRVRGKHVFNPTDGAIVGLLLVTKHVWVSPGQWGTAAFFAFLLACVGSLVVTRAARADVSLAFIAAFSALVFARSFYLGEPLPLPLHRLESGAFLLFSFFMISDPKTTPDSRAGRIVFAALVAATAWYVQFRLFRTNGLLWSLAIWSMGVPLLDRAFPSARYEWTRKKGDIHETAAVRRGALVGAGLV